MTFSDARVPAEPPFEQAQKAHGSLQRALQNELVLSYRSIADSAAGAYSGSGREAADLRQVAYLGLIKAVQRFDPALGVPFPSFAVPTIHGELKRYLRDQSWVIRPPRTLQDLRTAIAKARPELTQRLAHEPSLRELAAELGHDERLVAEAVNCHSSLRPESFDAPHDGGPLGELHGTLDERLEHAETLAMLARAVRRLGPDEKELLFRRYFHEESQQAIGERLGMTQMQVSRKLSRVLVKLQHELLGPPPDSGRGAAGGTVPAVDGPDEASA